MLYTIHSALPSEQFNDFQEPLLAMASEEKPT